MAARYATTINSLKRYLKDGDVPLKAVDGTMMQGYEQWLKDGGLCRNTTSYYLRNLRTIYNHAVDDGLVPQSSPFKHVYTGIDKTVKRALPLEIIKQLKSLLIYRRQKTSQQIYIKWEPEMQEIVEKYKSYNSPYLLPIAKGEGAIVWRQYKSLMGKHS